MEIYPIWLCPFNLPTRPGMVRQRAGTNVLFVDIGAYGVTEKEGEVDYGRTRGTSLIQATSRYAALVRSRRLCAELEAFR